MEWILITEKLPPVEEEVLIYSIYKTIRIWSRTGQSEKASFWKDNNGYWREKDEVIAWRYLPEPPSYIKSKTYIS